MMMIVMLAVMIDEGKDSHSGSFIIIIIIVIITIILKIIIIIWQVFLKSKIMDNIHKYYFLIAFTAYMRYYKRKSPSSLAL